RLTCKRRAISRSGMPSWWSRKIALRLSASIMEMPQAVVKGSYPAQDGCGEQIGLDVKGPAFEPRVLAFGDEPLHVILGGLPQSFQRQGQIALDDLLAQRPRPTKIAVSQLLNLPYAQAFVADSCHELL